MKVTIEIPDTTKVLTYQYVYEDPEKYYALAIKQNVMDSNALEAVKEAEKSDPHT